MATVHVVTPGLLTTVQDEGRWGYQSSGVPVAGPIDPVAHRVANALVGNPRSAAVLEVTLVGPVLGFGDERVVAVTGAAFDVSIDDRPVATNEAVVVTAGSVVRIGPRRRGARAYVAIEGGIVVPPVLGSRATHLTTAMGGLGGRALVAGDELPIGARPRSRVLRLSPAMPREWPAEPVRLRVLRGPNSEAFSREALDVLQSGPFTVGRDSDRMGYRLEGPVLAGIAGRAIISDATPIGALQVPPSGQPILLMADRPTIGGYPKMATVISADLGAAGQLAPGDRIVFALCSMREAMAALVEQEQVVMALESRVAS